MTNRPARLPHLCAFLLLLCSVPVTLRAQGNPASDFDPDPDSGFEQIEMFTRVLEIIRQNYVDDDKVTYERLINSALEGMLADLDPHCQFMHPKVFEQLKQNTGSTYQGVGITISFRNETLTIVTVREDGPAARAGVLAGDNILKINGMLIEGIGLSEAIALLKGEPGQKLKLTLRRPATKELLEVDMTREVIQQQSVKEVALLDEALTKPYKIGYARILQFSEPTASELANALDKLEDKGMQAFILDLRNNPGGLLTSAVDVCGEFVDPDTVVLTTEGRPGLGRIQPYRTSERKRRDRKYPMAILINHASASGAEVVAGALQDMKRAIIVGETSFGKGSVQSILPLSKKGTAIRLTTAKYYTPSHRTIHENGVVPNIIASLSTDEEKQLARWRGRATLPEAERKRLEKNFKDRQLVRAIDAMKGALVYQGGDPSGKSRSKPPAKPKPTPTPKPKSEPKPETKPEPEKPKAAKPKPAPGKKPATGEKPAPAPEKSGAPAKPEPEPEPAPEPKGVKPDGGAKPGSASGSSANE